MIASWSCCAVLNQCHIEHWHLPTCSLFWWLLFAWEACLSIEKFVYDHASACHIQLKIQLQTLKKGTMPMSTCLQNLESISYSFYAIGQPITDSNLVHHALSGLTLGFWSFYHPTVTAHPPILTFTNLQALLLDQELRLWKHYFILDYNSRTTNPLLKDLLPASKWIKFWSIVSDFLCAAPIIWSTLAVYFLLIKLSHGLPESGFEMSFWKWYFCEKMRKRK